MPQEYSQVGGAQPQQDIKGTACVSGWHPDTFIVKNLSILNTKWHNPDIAKIVVVEIPFLYNGLQYKADYAAGVGEQIYLFLSMDGNYPAQYAQVKQKFERLMSIPGTRTIYERPNDHGNLSGQYDIGEIGDDVKLPLEKLVEPFVEHPELNVRSIAELFLVTQDDHRTQQLHGILAQVKISYELRVHDKLEKQAFVNG